MSPKEYKDYISHVKKLRKNVTPKKAKAFLLEAGIITPTGKLSKKYR